jgi:hypothetical protein
MEFGDRKSDNNQVDEPAVGAFQWGERHPAMFGFLTVAFFGLVATLASGGAKFLADALT